MQGWSQECRRLWSDLKKTCSHKPIKLWIGSVIERIRKAAARSGSKDEETVGQRRNEKMLSHRILDLKDELLL